MQRSSVFIYSILLLAALPHAAFAQMELSTARPLAGQPVTISLPEGADTLIVTYRPNSAISTQEILPVSAGQAQWTPVQAGIVSLSSPGIGSQNVSVRFSRPPAGGILVLILAGTILFGGAIFAMWHLFLSTAPRTDPTRRPDT